MNTNHSNRILFYYRPSQVCAKVSTEIEKLNIPIDYINVEKLDTLPDFLEGTPTLIVQPENFVMKGSKILEFVNLIKKESAFNSSKSFLK